MQFRIVAWYGAVMADTSVRVAIAINAVNQVKKALYETISEAGESGVPEGIMYAACAAHGISFEAFRICLGLLECEGKITRSNFVCYNALKERLS